MGDDRYGKWKVVKRLGAGGQGEVFKVRDTGVEDPTFALINDLAYRLKELSFYQAYIQEGGNYTSSDSRASTLASSRASSECRLRSRMRPVRTGAQAAHRRFSFAGIDTSRSAVWGVSSSRRSNREGKKAGLTARSSPWNRSASKSDH